MRLLHVITALHTGGAERMLAQLSHHWANGPELHVAYLKPIHTLAGAFHPSAHLHPLGLGVGTAFALRRLVRHLRPAIIHTHLPHADILGLAATQGMAPRRFITLHNARFRTGRADALFQAAYRQLLSRWATDVQAIAISDAVAQQAIGVWGMAPGRVHTVLNPLVVPGPRLARAEARARLGLPPEADVLLALGRLEPQKGLIYLLQALAILAGQGLRPRLYLVGEGTLRTSLEADAAALGLQGQVTFTGLSDEPGLYLSAADALVLPSLFEGLGNVMAEAFAFGLPVLASNLEGPAEIVEPGRTGYLYPAADAAAWAEGLALFLRQADRTALGLQAQARAAAWPSPAEYAQQLLGLYKGQTS